MLHDTHPARRAGFTLIELLVVIAIMALLAALVASGVGQIRTAQMSRTTDQTVVKLQQGIDQMWKAVVTQAREDRTRKRMPPALVGFCDGDEDRAEVLWVYMNLRREFPQSFAEAQANVPSTGSFGGVVLPPRQTFANATGGSLDAYQQSAALLYLILQESSSRGVTFSMDDVTQGAQKQVGGFPVVTDAWGTPISFVRFAQTLELNQPPYVPSAASTNLYDQNDQKRKLWDWTNGTRKPQVQLGLGDPGTGQPLTFTYSSTNLAGQPIWNRRPTVIAAGENKAFEGDPTGDTDDHYGYRLMRQGNRGE
jgi:prepilin-type N-terminal cleavage/methylation domain-containing protein